MLAFASAAAVRIFFRKLQQEELDCRALAGKKVLAVGSHTEEVLREHGICPDFVPSRYDGIHLAEEALREGILPPGSRILLPGAEQGSPDLGRILTEAGMEFSRLPLYRTLSAACPPENWDPLSADFVTFTSGSCVRGFAEAAGQKLKPEGFRRIRAVCIGNQTAEQAEKFGMQTFVAEQATLTGMVQCLTSCVQG